MITRFNTIYERDRQQDRRTDGRTDTAWRHRPRLCIASRAKTVKPLASHIRCATYGVLRCDGTRAHTRLCQHIAAQRMCEGNWTLYEVKRRTSRYAKRNKKLSCFRETARRSVTSSSRSLGLQRDILVTGSISHASLCTVVFLECTLIAEIAL